MPVRKLAAAAALALAAASAPAFALYQSATHSVGFAVADVAVDPVTGRAFAAISAGGRSFEGSVTVLNPDGSTFTFPQMPLPGHLALSKTHRKLVVTHGSADQARIIDVDSLEVTVVQAGWATMRAVVSEKLGKAYLIGRNNLGSTPPWLNPGSLSGTLTEIDLRAGTSRVIQVQGMEPTLVTVDDTANRVYIAGHNYFRTGEVKPGFVQGFDTAAGALVGTPMRLGRLPVSILPSSERREVYVLGHVDVPRPQYPALDPRHNGIRPALFFLDASTLAIKRTIDLPDTADAASIGGLSGNLSMDPTTGRLYALDIYHNRFAIVNAGSGDVQVIDMEGQGRGMGFDPATGNLLVNMPFLGHAAVYSAAGERLDTVPLTREARLGEPSTYYAIVPDGSGRVFAANQHDGTVTVLQRQADLSGLQNLTDLWWNAAESGWGLFLDQQGTSLFGALFVEDIDGVPGWYVMSNGKRQGDGSFAGLLYRTRGPVSRAIANVAAVGAMRITPKGDGSASLAYEIAGAQRSSTVTRQQFAQADRECRWSIAASMRDSASSNFTSLWFDPAQPGWGVALSHRADTMFGVVFTYDTQDRASWAVMSDGVRQANGSVAGVLYRMGSKVVTSSGTMALQFHSANAATLSYELDGTAVTRSIVRQVFSTPVSDCSS